jgi:hypothetical protein
MISTHAQARLLAALIHATYVDRKLDREKHFEK